MRHIIPDLELEEIQSLTDITLSETSDSIVKEKVAFRRKLANELRLRGYTNKEIAEKIGCNLSTVEKDFRSIWQNARKWHDDENVTGYCQSINNGIVLCDKVIEDLQILYQEASDSETKLKILALVFQYQTKKTQLYEKTRAVQQFLEKSTSSVEKAQ